MVRLQLLSRFGKVTDPTNHLPICSILGFSIFLPSLLGHHAYHYELCQH